jgi:hypothetical protein
VTLGSYARVSDDVGLPGLLPPAVELSGVFRLVGRSGHAFGCENDAALPVISGSLRWTEPAAVTGC